MPPTRKSARTKPRPSAKRSSATSARDSVTRADIKKFGAEADKILDECQEEVAKGLGNKHFDVDAVRQLRLRFFAKIIRRLKNGGNWNAEKRNPLIVALHMGQICNILAIGPTVGPSVATAAALAIKADEICPARGGAGQWCF